MRRPDSKDRLPMGGWVWSLCLVLTLAGMGIAASGSGSSSIVRPRDPWAITLTGTVTDTACGTAFHKTLIHNDALCVRTCVELGAKYALATNKTTYELRGQHEKLYDYAGEQVQIKGERVGKSMIMVESVVPVIVEATHRGK